LNKASKYEKGTLEIIQKDEVKQIYLNNKSNSVNYSKRYFLEFPNIHKETLRIKHLITSSYF